MDAPEEDLDIKLQKISGDLLGDFDRSLPILLRRQDGSLRSRVRYREAYRLAQSVLGPFQELPQLLDPHLPNWLPILSEAYLEHQQKTRGHQAKALSLRNNLLMPISTAISMLLYTFCKIRGEKVIVRFLNVETKYIELLLSAFEDAERRQEAGLTNQVVSAIRQRWEESYILLLWLSHLMLAPFDLATISSAGIDEDELPVIPGFRWPNQLPGITVRIIPMAIKYLASPGKERDAAKFLLVRISMRKDMQQLGVLDALVQWSLFTLRPRKDDQDQTAYRSIGILSYLAGILTASSDTSDMDKYLTTIFHAVHATLSEETGSAIVTSSAQARKMAIKVMRSIAVSISRKTDQGMEETELVETTIGYLLESLADNDTPVRLAASKALSIITLKLDVDMASQVVDAVLESLNKKVLWVKNHQNPNLPSSRDLSAVDALEWHGLMLTLSHLVYRRSPPADNLLDIFRALILGLSFEQRSASGGSVGTNVRDAACFGIWALARRYTTAELLAVPTTPGAEARSQDSKDASVLQILATELVVAACLDPAGNIRRGSSAALQELIGRHPDTVDQGIWVVQTVDYHAVARRSRAIQDVALSATKLSSQYGEAVLQALLRWRGIGSPDAPARRSAGISYGAITAELALASQDPIRQLTDSVILIDNRIKALQTREVDELHGLLLSFAAVLDSLPAMVKSPTYSSSLPPGETMRNLASHAIKGIHDILENCQSKTYRRPELVAEAACRLIISSFPLLQIMSLHYADDSDSLSPDVALVSGSTLLSGTDTLTFSAIVSALDAAGAARHRPPSALLDKIKSTVGSWLSRQEQEVIVAASEASFILLVFCPKTERDEIIRKWADTVRHRPSSRGGVVGGYFAALTVAYPILSTVDASSSSHADRNLLCDALLTRWASDRDVDIRVSILQSLTQSELLRQNAVAFLDLIAEGLDDYTTNARGDIGSHVRLEAIRTVKSLWKDLDSQSAEDASLQEVISRLFLRILRLAAEKLDRVRVEAQSALKLVLTASYSTQLDQSTFSSKNYFRFLLDLLSHDWLHPAVSRTAKASPETWMEELMSGFVTSADTGNEELVIASRAALCDFCETSPDRLTAVCTGLVRNLKARQGVDRAIVPTLEIIAFLFHVGIFQRCATGFDYRSLCLQVQKAGYKTGNVRKIEACIRVYGAVAAIDTDTEAERREPRGDLEPSPGGQKRREGVLEARKRLGALAFHPWPRIRSLVVDELWSLLVAAEGAGLGSTADKQKVSADQLKGVDWGKAEKGTVRALVEQLGLS